jgi:hypothetical protein
MNHSANEVPLDGRTQNSIYSKTNFQGDDENDPYMHQVPQQSFEGVHGVNEDYEEDQDFDHEQQEDFAEVEYEEGYQEDADPEYYPDADAEGQLDPEEYPKVTIRRRTNPRPRTLESAR